MPTLGFHFYILSSGDYTYQIDSSTSSLSYPGSRLIYNRATRRSMDKVKEFQDMFKIQRDLAEDILQQFNFDIEAAANFFLSGPPNEDVEMVDVSSNEPPPPLPPKSHKRRLSFNINFHTDEDKLNMVNFHLDDVPENRTVGDLKDLLINKYRDELASLAAKMGVHTEVDNMKKFIHFEGMQNPSGLSDSATLKSLHLPINNTWASYFKKRARLRRPSSDGGIKSMSYNIKIRLISSHSNGESNSHHSKSGTKLIPLLGITDVTSLAELRRMAAQEAKVSVSNLRWSAKAPKNSNWERLVIDLNHTTMDNTLLRYKLKSDQVYIFDVSTIPLPSTSKPSGSQISSSHKSSRPYRSIKKPIIIDDDDDGDAVDQQEIDEDEEDYPVYEISDDDEPGLRAAAESTNPQNLPLNACSSVPLMNTSQIHLEQRSLTLVGGKEASLSPEFCHNLHNLRLTSAVGHLTLWICTDNINVGIQRACEKTGPAAS
ncbi:hypothetical protein ACTXT7_013016 [Hymenolepis weldensis]